MLLHRDGVRYYISEFKGYLNKIEEFEKECISTENINDKLFAYTQSQLTWLKEEEKRIQKVIEELKNHLQNCIDELLKDSNNIKMIMQWSIKLNQASRFSTPKNEKIEIEELRNLNTKLLDFIYKIKHLCENFVTIECQESEPNASNSGTKFRLRNYNELRNYFYNNLIRELEKYEDFSHGVGMFINTQQEKLNDEIIILKGLLDKDDAISNCIRSWINILSWTQDYK